MYTAQAYSFQYRLPLTFPSGGSLELRHAKTTATHTIPDAVERCVFDTALPAIGFWQIKIAGELLGLDDDNNRPLLFVGVTPHEVPVHARAPLRSRTKAHPFIHTHPSALHIHPCTPLHPWTSYLYACRMMEGPYI